MKQLINIERSDDNSIVTITTPLNYIINLDDLIYACQDNDMDLNSHTTGHLSLLDDRYNKVYMMNDYGIDVIEELNEKHIFTCTLSILDYSDFKQ